MRLLLLPVLLALVATSQVLSEDAEPQKEVQYWTDSELVQDNWLPRDPFREILFRMTRKPRPHQFIGLMGKRSTANAQIPRKRHKVNSFVGLMGKRSQEAQDSYEWSTIDNYDKRR
ncbi:protachykinin-1 [Synchiropus picturatus]